MGMNVGGNSGGVHSEINVTPLIDVWLVLLIIFIVIVPIMVKSEALEVPNTAEPGSVSEVEPLTVTIKNDLQVGTMDSIRGIADDSSHDDIKIALKLDTAPPR